MTKTAVVILNWNGISWLQQFLGNVVSCSAGDDTLVCVADNGSTDGSAAWVAENFRSVRVIRFDKNNGFAGGYNLALQQIDAEYFVLLNSDVEVARGWLTPLVSCLDNDPEVASCQPKIRSGTNKDQFEYAGAAGGFIDKYGYTFCRGRIFNVIERDEGQYDDTIDIFWSTGACMAVRNEAWKRCGGFDPDFFAHMEEVDLCWRFHIAGYRVAYVPGSVVYHAGGGALPYNTEFKTYLNFRNNLFLLYKNLPGNKLHRVLFIRMVLDGIAALMFVFKGNIKNLRAIWNAHIDYHKSIKTLKSKRKSVGELASGKPVDQILNKSLVFEFYIKGNKTYSMLIKNIHVK
jgi:GT2 family glycosyltransferase